MMNGVGWMTRCGSFTIFFLFCSLCAAASFSRLDLVKEKISSSIDFKSRLGLEALLDMSTPPFSISDGIATAITMSLEERRERHAAMLKVLKKNDITAWRTRFVDALLQRNREATST